MRYGKLLVPLVGIISASVAGLACAEDAGRFYIGGNLGQSKTQLDDAQHDLNSALGAAGFGVTGSSKKDTDTGYKIFAGYQLNQNVAIEGGYADFGKFSISATTSPAGTATADVKASGIFLDLVGLLPVGSNFSLLGRVGVIHANVKEDLTAGGAVTFVPGADTHPSATSTNFSAGLGVQYDFDKVAAIRAEWQRFSKLGNDDTGKGDVDLLSLGVIFRF